MSDVFCKHCGVTDERRLHERPSVRHRNQSDSNSSRLSLMMLRHLRIAQRMMPRCRIVNSPSMIARFTMSSILSSADDPAVAS